MARRPSQQTVAVLTALAVDPEHWRYGYELGKEVELKAVFPTPILMRLADRGSAGEHVGDHRAQGRPPRHLYRLTAAGARAAAEVAQQSSRARPHAAPRPARSAG